MPSTAILTLLLLSLVTASADDPNNECVYSIYVKTGPWIKSGTDSKISLTVSDATSRFVTVPNLESWGLMGPKYDYYERDNLDIFAGRGPCIGAPICRLNLTSDGIGPHHGWYCEYLEITSTGPHKQCAQTAFYVEQWLATDAAPYQLTAVLDGCKREEAESEKRRLVVGKAVEKGAVAE
uniref:PLAT domain-containing protein n=1 Tax=Kalanchoe fedtschenkoi TaxID=63787 RepID=A0A7N0RDT1_KALFE